MLIDASVKLSSRAAKLVEFGKPLRAITLADKRMCLSCLQVRARPLSNLHRCPECGARCCS